MNDISILMEELCSLEVKMTKTVTALTEALVRQSAALNRGPLNNPNPEDWEVYIQELRGELSCYYKSLEERLSTINWQGPCLPSLPAIWPAWWDEVRRYATSISLEKTSPIEEMKADSSQL